MAFSGFLIYGAYTIRLLIRSRIMHHGRVATMEKVRKSDGIFHEAPVSTRAVLKWFGKPLLYLIAFFLTNKLFLGPFVVLGITIPIIYPDSRTGVAQTWSCCHNFCCLCYGLVISCRVAKKAIVIVSLLEDYIGYAQHVTYFISLLSRHHSS